jgi:integrase/recombinase XerD
VRELPARTARLVALFREHLDVRYGGRTAPSYEERVLSFLSWLCERGLDLAEVKTSDLEAYRTALFATRSRFGRTLAAETQAGQITALKSFFRFLYRGGWVIHDPAAAVERPRRDQRLPRVVLTELEAERILAAPPHTTPTGLRDRAILETLYATGVRVSELIALKADQVDTDERVLRVVLGKGRRDRHLPLTRTAAQAIERYLFKARPPLAGRSTHPHLFLGGYGRVLTRGTANVIVTRWARRARVKKHVTCHTFRHTMATHLLRRGADIRHIQALLGHRCLTTTERYTRVEVADLRRVLERAHPRGR